MNDFLTPWPEDPVNPVVTKKGTMVLWDGIPKICYFYNAKMCASEANKYRGVRYTDMDVYHWLLHRADLLNRIARQRGKERQLLALLEKQ